MLQSSYWRVNDSGLRLCVQHHAYKEALLDIMFLLGSAHLDFWIHYHCHYYLSIPIQSVFRELDRAKEAVKFIVTDSSLKCRLA